MINVKYKTTPEPPNDMWLANITPFEERKRENAHYLKHVHLQSNHSRKSERRSAVVAAPERWDCIEAPDGVVHAESRGMMLIA